MVTPGNINEATTELDTITHDPDIDAKSIARPGRDVHDRGELPAPQEGPLGRVTAGFIQKNFWAGFPSQGPPKGPIGRVTAGFIRFFWVGFTSRGSPKRPLG